MGEDRVVKGKKKRKRVDMSGVSLARFASAKQAKSQRMSQKAHRENMKTVRGYKKLLKKMQSEGDQVEEDPGCEQTAGEGGGDHLVNERISRSEIDDRMQDVGENKLRKRAKKDDHVAQADKKNEASREAMRQQREHERKERDRRQDEIKNKARARKKERGKFRRTNARGQPLMKFQVEKILQQLDEERKAKN